MVDETRPVDSSQEAQERTSGDNEELRQKDAVDAVADVNLEELSESEPVVEKAQRDLEDVASEEGAADQSAVSRELEAKVAELKAQLEDRTNQYMRIAADFENHRRRTSKEREDQQLQIKCNTISELLPVIDNFERARSQIKPQTEQEMTIHKSYQSVYKQLVDCLKRLGVSAMRAEGQEFDPNLHEAVMREPTDQHPEGTVIEELVRGYMIADQDNSRVLRHAMVKVASPPEPTDSDPISEDSEGE